MRKLILLVPFLTALVIGCTDKKADVPKDTIPLPKEGPTEAKKGGPAPPPPTSAQ